MVARIKNSASPRTSIVYPCVNISLVRVPSVKRIIGLTCSWKVLQDFLRPDVTAVTGMASHQGFPITPVQIRFFGWPIWTAPERLRKKQSNEGHGFSRAVIGCALDGFTGCGKMLSTK